MVIRRHRRRLRRARRRAPARRTPARAPPPCAAPCRRSAVTCSCSNRKTKVRSRSSPIWRRTSAGRSQTSRLERSDRLLARLVVELLVGVARLPLRRGVLVEPAVDPLPQRRRERRVVEHHVLEIGGEVDLGRLDPREIAEGRARQRRRAVLHRPGQAVAVPRHLRQRFQRLQVELDVGDRSVRQHHAAVRRAGLHRDLADPGVGAERVERPLVARP